jgi:hypothetical protein
MSARRNKSRGRGRGGEHKPRTLDLWRPVAPLPEPEPITPATDPAALIRSLGHPPLAEQSIVAEHYLAAVVERAAGLASALAATGNLLAMDDERGD